MELLSLENFFKQMIMMGKNVMTMMKIVGNVMMMIVKTPEKK